MEKESVRVWVDGCFDMMHFGHANALRQAKAFGDKLVVGVHSDIDIGINKGPTVMTEKERYTAVAACKWVDEVVEGAPYQTQLGVMDEHNCDICVHGDDITTMADGSDSYALVKAAGRYKECKRTIGISTTELVGRMLLLTKNHHLNSDMDLSADDLLDVKENKIISPYTNAGCQYFPTIKRLLEFSTPRDPKPSDVIIYVDDPGHSQLFKKAKELGDYLIVGIHDDPYVDEVIIGAPHKVTSDLLEKVHNISYVVHGQTPVMPDIDGSDPYEVPKQRNMYREVETDFSYLTIDIILERIISNRQRFVERNKKKQEKELQFLTEDAGSSST